jgi:drug/metabolite transporter (DMT)-like permease
MFFLLFTFFLIASGQIANKYISFFVEPEVFVFLRMFFSGILLFIFYRREGILKKIKDNALLLYSISLTITFFPAIFRAFAFRTITASRASFWGCFEPFFTSLWVYVLFDQKLTRNQFLGCLLSFLGSFFFIYMQAKESMLGGLFFCLGDLAQITSVFISRFGWIQVQRLIQQDLFTPKELNAICFLFASVSSLFMLWIRGGSFVGVGELCRHNYSFVISLIYTIIVGNMIAYGLYSEALRTFPITYISIAGLSIPLFVHIISVIIKTEHISFSFFTSLFFLFVSLYVFQKK